MTESEAFLGPAGVKPRAKGGDHNQELLVTLFGVPHRAAHMGGLVVSGAVKYFN